MLEDKRLIWKLKRGNKEAMCRIYEKYRDDLLRILASLLRERSNAEDVVHDVFIDFVKNSKAFSLTGSLRGYLCSCVVNKARNFNRTMLRKQTVNLDDMDPIISTLKRPDEWIIYDEQSKELCDAMASLPYEQREVVILRLQVAMKFKEIAAIQKTSVKTALSRYRYGIDKLRSLLDCEVIK